MKKRFYIFLVAGLSLTACTNSLPVPASRTTPAAAVHYQKPTPEKEERFRATMKEVALSTKDNPKYHRMALDTPEKKEWFKSLMYRLWDRQITRAQFIAEGLEKYPSHHYEFEFIANGFQQHS